MRPRDLTGRAVLIGAALTTALAGVVALVPGLAPTPELDPGTRPSSADGSSGTRPAADADDGADAGSKRSDSPDSGGSGSDDSDRSGGSSSDGSGGSSSDGSGGSDSDGSDGSGGSSSDGSDGSDGSGPGGGADAGEVPDPGGAAGSGGAIGQLGSGYADRSGPGSRPVELDPGTPVLAPARLACTRLIDDVDQLRDAMLTSGPDEIICVRGPRDRPAVLTALAFARSQLGQPYRWGGRGRKDGGFDCSGLTSASYAAAGVPIPRTAQAQYTAGPKLATDEQIKPGDLVFFGGGPSSVGHVGIAVSATQMINAPTSGEVVKIGPIHRRDFVGATRPVSGRDGTDLTAAGSR